MKINRRLKNIAIVSLLIAFVLTGAIYKSLAIASRPEHQETIAYFLYNVDKDSAIKESDVIFKKTPVSLVPKTAVRDAKVIKGKRLISKAEAGEMLLSGMLIERGDNLVDIKQFWTIGIDVTNISNFLGGNIKEGKEYILKYKYPTGEVVTVSKAKISSMVDSTGKLITSTGDGLVKTINVSVESENIADNIVRAKGNGNFELVVAPEGVEVKPIETIEVKKEVQPAKTGG